MAVSPPCIRTESNYKLTIKNMSLYIDLKKAVLVAANDPEGDDMEILDLIKDLSSLVQERIITRLNEVKTIQVEHD